MGRLLSLALCVLLLSMTAAYGAQTAASPTPLQNESSPWANLTVSADLSADERLVLFPAYARPQPGTDDFILRVHAWVYEPEEGLGARSVLINAFESALGLKDIALDRTFYVPRSRLFLVDNERGKEITVAAFDKTLGSAKTTAGGHAVVEMALPSPPSKAATWIKPLVRTGEGAYDPLFSRSILIVPATGFSIISDIDDTVKLSEVLDKKKLITNTFGRAFEAVEGMATLYRELERENGAVVHYVSGSPWQLGPPLADFLDAEGFPAGSLHLRDFRIKDKSFQKFFGDPIAYKRDTISKIFKDFPQRRFVLIGDSGEKDPEVYGEIYRQHPKQVIKILIRNAGGVTAQRMSKAFEGVSKQTWQLFNKASELDGLPKKLAVP